MGLGRCGGGALAPRISAAMYPSGSRSQFIVRFGDARGSTPGATCGVRFRRSRSLCGHQRPGGPRGPVAARARRPPRPTERRHLRLDAGRGNGLGPGRTPASRSADPQHAGRRSRARRHAARARLSHRTLGSRSPRARCGGGAASRPDHPVRRLRHRPVRWPHAGHDRHDGQPSLPKRRRRWSSAAWCARFRQAGPSSAWRPATRACRRC